MTDDEYTPRTYRGVPLSREVAERLAELTARRPDPFAPIPVSEATAEAIQRLSDQQRDDYQPGELAAVRERVRRDNARQWVRTLKNAIRRNDGVE